MNTNRLPSNLQPPHLHHTLMPELQVKWQVWFSLNDAHNCSAATINGKAAIVVSGGAADLAMWKRKRPVWMWPALCGATITLTVMVYERTGNRFIGEIRPYHANEDDAAWLASLIRQPEYDVHFFNTDQLHRYAFSITQPYVHSQLASLVREARCHL